jgi:hypothetical protein
MLLDLRLLNAQIRVIVTGGTYDKKELVVSIESIDGQLRIMYKRYKTLIRLTPEWVTPKHPHPTRDKGLLLVIQGDHCGKYVRRIHHRYEGNKIIIILGVVNRVAGCPEVLTDQQLELDSSYLCLCDEKDKNPNESLDAIRVEACKTRAK